jgi:hypothetical protein
LVSRVDRSSDVDFDVTSAEGDPDLDEILVEPPDRLAWLSRPARLLITIVVAAALVGILVVHAVSGGSSRPSAGATSSGPARPGSTAPVVPPLHQRGPAAAASGNPATCPHADDGLSLCSTSSLVPAAALTAVLRHFPGAQIRSKLEVDLRDIGYGSAGLWYREIRAHSGAVAIVVEVRKRQAADRTRGYVSEAGSGTTVLDEVVTGALTIRVRVTTAAGLRPQLGRVQQLAHDARLRARVA